MTSRLILHIGAPKTGTTALQGFLKREYRPLRRCGFNPVFLFNPSSRAFAEMFGTLDDRQPYFRRNELRSGAGAALHFGRALAAASVRLARSRLTWHNTVLSSEHFFLRLTTPAHVEDLARYLGKFFGEVHVVLYRRDPAALTRSLYWEALKAGATVTLDEFAANLPPHLCQDRVFETWAQVFGHRNMSVRAYAPGRDTVGDFVEHALGISPNRLAALGAKLPPRRTNCSPHHDAFEEMRRFNTAHATRGQSGPGLIATDRRRDSFVATLLAGE